MQSWQVCLLHKTIPLLRQCAWEALPIFAKLCSQETLYTLWQTCVMHQTKPAIRQTAWQHVPLLVENVKEAKTIIATWQACVQHKTNPNIRQNAWASLRLLAKNDENKGAIYNIWHSCVMHKTHAPICQDAWKEIAVLYEILRQENIYETWQACLTYEDNRHVCQNAWEAFPHITKDRNVEKAPFPLWEQLTQHQTPHIREEAQPAESVVSTCYPSLVQDYHHRKRVKQWKKARNGTLVLLFISLLYYYCYHAPSTHPMLATAWLSKLRQPFTTPRSR